MPGQNTTGGKRRLGSITKHGNMHAPSISVQSAWQILRAGDADDPLRRWADALAKTRDRRSLRWRWHAASRGCSGRCGATAPAPAPATAPATATPSPPATSDRDPVPARACDRDRDRNRDRACDCDRDRACDRDRDPVRARDRSRGRRNPTASR